MDGNSRSRTGLSLRSRAAAAASNLLEKTSTRLADGQYSALAGRLDSARAKLDGRGEGGRQTDILGRDVHKARERERKMASVYSEDHIVIFPGYAVMRDVEHTKEVIVEVSGFAYRTRPLERASRSQKLFVSAARQLAGLGRSTSKESTDVNVDIQGEDAADIKQDAYAKLLSIGEEAKLTDDMEIELMETSPADESLHVAPLQAQATTRPFPPNNTTSEASRQSSMSSYASNGSSQTPSEAGRMQSNLQQRLRAFFAQKLEHRHIRVEVHLADEKVEPTPLARGSLMTIEGGGFRQSVSFPAHLVNEGDLLQVTVELLPDPDADAPSVEGQHQRTDGCLISVARRGTPHVISDYDDTCKHTEVLAGARALVRNVFARDLRDCIVPGIQPWYHDMAEASALFHYVSNSPWELAPVVRQFLMETEMPQGQILLKQYARGSGLISGLWESAGARKRGNVETILKAFPDSQFLCIGDSGEQDLELYCSLAAHYPAQIRAIFIRDVTTPFAFVSQKASTTVARKPARSTTDPALFAREGLSKLSIDLQEDNADALSPNNPLRPSQDADMPESRRKLLEAFYRRIANAERHLPDGTILRLFQNGDEVRKEGVDLIKQMAIQAR